MHKNLTILIVGGYGTFGGRTVELLEGEERLTLIVAGRTLHKANDFCQTRTQAKARLIPAQLDRTQSFHTLLDTLRPDIVIDASGPFQEYGDDLYNLVEACIERKINYLDLADGSHFVAGISAFDASARSAGVFALSGVSSFPVLTAAVVRRLSQGMERVHAIRGGIAPSPYAGVGSNVIRAIAGYAGQEVTLQQAGHAVKLYPLTSSLRYTVAPPGKLPLRNLHFSLVDVPDLHVLATAYPDTTIWMGAAPVPEILHRMLNMFAWLVRAGLIKSLLPIAGLMEFVMRHVRWGEHRGGMFVEVKGQENGAHVTKSWHLLAEGHHGPMIPSMAVEAIIRKILKGEPISAGARPALAEVTLQDYEDLFSKRTIYTGDRQDHPAPSGPLFKKILGSAWSTLPVQIQKMHDIESVAQASGLATIEHGHNPLARLVRMLMGFPQAGTDVPVHVNFTIRNGIERWHRTFGNTSFYSDLSAGCGRSARLFTEKFGVISFAMALTVEENRLRLVLRRWKLLGIPLPMWLCVKSDSYESVDDQGRFNFHVHISHPLTGLVVLYKGWLLRKE